MRSKQLGPHETLSQKGKKIKITVMATTKTGGQQLDELLPFQTPSCKILIGYQGNSVCSGDTEKGKAFAAFLLRMQNLSAILRKHQIQWKPTHQCQKCQPRPQDRRKHSDGHRLQETGEPRSLTGPWGTDLYSGDVMGNLVDRCGAWALLTGLSCS